LYRFDLGQSTWGIIRAVQFSPDGKILSGVSSHNNVIRFWDVASKTEVFSTTATSVAYSPDGQIMATGNKYGAIQLWNVGSWTKITSIAAHTDWISFLVFSPDGQILISGSAADNTACLWDVKTANKLSTLEGVLSVAFSPDGRTLAVGTNDYLSLYQIP
jgi:WD40 repeat protein